MESPREWSVFYAPLVVCQNKFFFAISIFMRTRLPVLRMPAELSASINADRAGSSRSSSAGWSTSTRTKIRSTKSSPCTTTTDFEISSTAATISRHHLSARKFESKKTKNISSLPPIPRYSCGKTTLDKEGNNWQRSTLTSRGSTVFSARNFSTTVNLTKASSLTFVFSAPHLSKATLLAFMFSPTAAP